MSFNRMRSFILIPLSFIIAALTFAAITMRQNRYVGILELLCVAVICILYLMWIYVMRRNFSKIVLQVSSKLDLSKKKSLSSFPMPVAVTNSVGDIEMFNALFAAIVSDSGEVEGSNISDFTGGMTIEEILAYQGVNARCGDRFYSVYSGSTKIKEKTYYVYYFIDNTELQKISVEYKLSRPSVAMISIDGIEELQANYKSSDFSEIRLRIERMVSEWSNDFNCICHKTGNDRYIMVIEERNLFDMASSRFKVLDNVRNFSYNDKVVGLTLSIGIGHGGNLSECETNSRQALEMAQSRGGDQVAIKKADLSYEFFGGISKGVEKKTKVKTRIMASTIAELIKASDKIMVMGHRFPDLDAMGAAVGMCAAAAFLEKPATIVTDESKSLAKPLLDRIESEGRGDLIESPSSALMHITKDTLLVVVDTHMVDFVEVPELLNKASSVIVIDHHRKSVNFINDAVLFFHDPGASSSSEMVTEILQYISNKPVIGKLEADALLSGITLDTRNFVLRAGVRSFEAAAYLKGCGADTVKVKKMFSSSLDSYKKRNEVVSAAEMFRNCAVSVVNFTSPDIRIICSQAADELLNINNVDASFVLFESKGIVNISARSLGNMNVQVIMESLGGGGHQTMAAAQLSDVGIDTAIARLQGAIDKYYSLLNK